MKEQSLADLIRSYLEYILSPDRISDADDIKTPTLSKLLDQLALRTHDTSGIFLDYDDENEVPFVYNDVFETLSLHFPTYGYYSTVLDIAPLTEGKNLALGDAIDDLTDIACDLSSALRVAEKHGEAAGQYEFVELYRIHWGSHLRKLQLYLHCQMTKF